MTSTSSSDQPLVANQVSDFDTPDTYEDFNEIFNREHKRIVEAMNSKVSGLYPLVESATFEQYFRVNDPQNYRNVYRLTLNFGALPNAQLKSVTHGLTLDSNFRLVRMYGSANFPGVQSLPLPYAHSTDTLNIALDIDPTYVNITTGSNRTNFTDTTVVIEYTKEL